MRISALELRVHGVGIASYPPGARLAERTLPDFEFVWIIAGDCTWQSAGVDYDCPPGTVLLGQPGTRERYRWDPEQRTRHGFVHFAVDDPDGLLPATSAWPRILRPQGEDVLRPLLRQVVLRRSEADELGRALAEQALTQALLVFVHHRWQLSGHVAAEDDIIAAAMQFVRRQWRSGRLRALSLAQLATAADVSEGHLIRCFRQELGCTPQQALRGLRLHEAAMQLARSERLIQDIAEQCGFESAFHFSRRFKRAYGASPRAFRAAIRAGADLPAMPHPELGRLLPQLWG